VQVAELRAVEQAAARDGKRTQKQRGRERRHPQGKPGGGAHLGYGGGWPTVVVGSGSVGGGLGAVVAGGGTVGTVDTVGAGGGGAVVTASVAAGSVGTVTRCSVVVCSAVVAALVVGVLSVVGELVVAGTYWIA
jgi:hypothetical protein